VDTTVRARFHPPPADAIRLLYRLGLGPLVGRVVLLLTTTGRKSGLPRVTPLQAELEGYREYTQRVRYRLVPGMC